MTSQTTTLECIGAQASSARPANDNATAQTFTINFGKSETTFKDWGPKEVTLEEFRDFIVTHNEQKNKSGFCFVPGEIVGERRKAQAIPKVSVLVYDVDGTQPLDEAYAIMNALPTLSWIYTTHSHNSTKTNLK